MLRRRSLSGTGERDLDFVSLFLLVGFFDGDFDLDDEEEDEEEDV
jgi:hypothetical protein